MAQHGGVQKHTDYGVLTILKQDDVGGLEVAARLRVAAPPIEGAVVNIGDMLETWTCGLYQATPHRVRSSAEHNRISSRFSSTQTSPHALNRCTM